MSAWCALCMPLICIGKKNEKGKKNSLANFNSNSMEAWLCECIRAACVCVIFFLVMNLYKLNYSITLQNIQLFLFFFSTIFECFFTFTLWLHSLSRLTLELCYIKQKLKFSHFFPIFSHVVADLAVCVCICKVYAFILHFFLYIFSVHFFSLSFLIVGTI